MQRVSLAAASRYCEMRKRVLGILESLTGGVLLGGTLFIVLLCPLLAKIAWVAALLALCCVLVLPEYLIACKGKKRK